MATLAQILLYLLQMYYKSG